MISVLILTRNEELDLPGCLASVAWSDDVHVFDSFSTDATPEIARAAGAHLHQRVFDDYATHRIAALRLAFAHPGCLILDADERPPRGVCAEMRRPSRAPPTEQRLSLAAAGFPLSAHGSNTRRSRHITSGWCAPNARATPAPSTK